MTFDFLNSTNFRMILVAIIFSVLATSFTGCSGSDKDSPERAAISGLVKFKGELVEEGMITFSPVAPTVGPSTGAKIVKGIYSISEESGPVVGTNLVAVTAYQKTGKKIEAGTPNPPGTMVDELVPLIPKEFNTQSKLTVQVDTGDNANTDFDLLKQ